MSIFGKDSPEVRKARDQRKIAKLQAKTRKDSLKLDAKEARTKARAKAGGVGGSFTLYSKRSKKERSCPRGPRPDSGSRSTRTGSSPNRRC